MIGVIGPRDAVESLYSVAVELGREQLLLKGVYRSLEDAAAIASSLDSACDVLLFTGRVPHRLATSTQNLHARLQYVPDGPIDLYRAIALLSVNRPMNQLSFSMDTVSRQVVEEVFVDLGLPAPRHIFPLDDIPGDWTDIRTILGAFHRERFESGQVEECVTWLGQVYDDLLSAGIPVRRVTHSHATYRETLLRAELADSAARSQASQVTAALVRSSALRVKRRDRIRADELDRFAERLQGRVVPTAEPGNYIIYTTRGVLEAELSRVQSGFTESLSPGGTSDWQVGYGVGSSAKEAAQLAERAASFGASSDQARVLYSDGTALTIDTSGESRPVQLRITNDQLTSTEERPALRPYSMERLVAALRQLDPQGFTAKQFGAAYGVQERSARRILGSLESSGVANRSGIQTSPGVGRPNTVYAVDMEKLLAL